MFEFQSVRRSFPRNLAENSEAASFLDQTTSFETEVQERQNTCIIHDVWRLLILSNEEKTNDYENFEKGMIYMKILKRGRRKRNPCPIRVYIWHCRIKLFLRHLPNCPCSNFSLYVDLFQEILPRIARQLRMILIIWSRGKLNISFSLKFWLQF
jgi:hypothetical protein